MKWERNYLNNLEAGDYVVIQYPPGSDRWQVLVWHDTEDWRVCIGRDLESELHAMEWAAGYERNVKRGPPLAAE